MMTVKHRKTYTLEVEINKINKEYAMLRDAIDKRESKPFKYMDEISKIIENDLRPLVPLRRLAVLATASMSQAATRSYI